MKRLNELIFCKFNTPIYGIKTDSRKVENGDLFVAIHGMNTDHHNFIKDAVEKGAAAIISEKKINVNVPVVIVKNTNKALRKVLKRFYSNIEKEFFFIGITGTDGKTTTSTFISKVLDGCANIGTNGLFYNDYYKSLDNTTPSIEELSSMFSDLKKIRCKYISMEVSSEALLHKRLDNIKYNVGIITNITEDHLNIHKDINNYINSKALLFTKIKKDGFALLNLDDKYYGQILKKCKCKTFTYGFDVNSDFTICKASDKKNVNNFSILHNGNLYTVYTSFTQKYNLYNLTAVFACLYLLGLDPDYILDKIRSIDSIPGRGEKLNFGQQYTIILDYAHTENAIKNILLDVNSNKNGRIITLTGSAGGREKEKRKKIGKIVTELSDIAIFTEDDPRYEKVSEIIADMLCEVTKKNYKIIENRKNAIHYALSIANKEDTILILGKGRDNYMAIFDKKVKYSDYDVIKSYFDSKKF
ncbi:MAG: UDP-N-acetylmuramoyl-L-alanyl-D-glutamate--2,6-diaminopimelate ligase [Bacilli bacterium]|nr:UDP-N-acetylmuramoyl-L-alanyl-D-glutamate--2,6-diaminopimelate ligase [Bacilli bacterium]